MCMNGVIIISINMKNDIDNVYNNNNVVIVRCQVKQENVQRRLQCISSTKIHTAY